MAVTLAVGIVCAPLFPTTPLIAGLMLVAAVLSIVAHELFQSGWKALLSLLLFLFLTGVLRPLVPDVQFVPDSLIEWGRGLSDWLLVRICDLGFSDESSALLRAMLLGDRSGLTDSVSQLYRLSGSAHVLALSGLHLGILFGAFNVLLVRVLSHRLRHVLGLSELFLIWTYALLTGFPVSLCRASFMMSLFVVSQVRLVGNDGWHTLGITALVLMLMSPSSVNDIGFQLSFAAVAGIFLFHPLLSDIWLPRHPFFRAVWQMFLVSFSAQLGVIPLLLHYFHYVSLSGILLSPLYILLATVIIYLALSALLVPMLVSIVDFIIRLQHSLMAYAVSLQECSPLRENFNWGKVMLLYLALLSFVPVLYRLRQSQNPFPNRRLLQFCSCWPYVLATLLLLTAVVVL